MSAESKRPRQGQGRGGPGGKQRPQGASGRPGGGRGRPAGKDGKPGRDGKPAQSRGGRQGGAPRDRRQEPRERTEAQKVYDGPPIPDDVSAKDLDRFARQELQNIPPKLAEKVARHLVMAGSLLHEDPALAHQHALAARARAMRNGLVREATGETAYALGNWSEALAEFRAARRITGRAIYAPMMADCERALKRPQKALEYDTSEIRAQLDEGGNAELTIVVAGARRDMGQVEASLQLLEAENLMSKSRADWVARLRYAYADTLLAAGRRDEAVSWFHRVVAVDGDKLTDAEERLAELEG
ncbi:tetratricopeptide repeat protein [Aeromicrobium piscarium]|uniref:Tetratricopeptide repeat protein n=1 Tax=Aeromicrobium piscarium TaxID=2590901 RepID=A0A554RF31_9ACTN|nr:tetratricopeptide repeat protein [Aeromicrobium piscarium]TSD52773.1 tetratricopeptide repeat protein [Aeromicrobium piscarium]